MRNREDWLVEQLDNESLNEKVRIAYEAELDAIASKLLITQENQKITDEKREEAPQYREPRSFEDRVKAITKREQALALKLEMSYDDWLKLAKSLYKITDNYEVVSIARGPENVRIWEESSEISARERVYTLIHWKYYDHFVRDGSFAYIPEEKSA